MTSVAVATEDELGEAIALRLISEVADLNCVTLKLRKNGSGYLRSKMDSWCQMAHHQIVVLLTDLDRVDCVVQLRNNWLGNRSLPKNLLLRVAVREVESWVLADGEALSSLLGKIVIAPRDPDALPDPKQALLNLARTAPRSVREDLVKVVDGKVSQALGYNARVADWIQTAWSPARAAVRSPSLARTRARIQDLQDVVAK